MHFESPWLLLLLALIPLAVWVMHRRPRPDIRFSTTATARAVGSSLRQRLYWLPLALRVAAMILLVIAIARPRIGLERSSDISSGIAIEMVIDKSGSMGYPMTYDSEQFTRIEVAKRVLADFVIGSHDDLGGRPNDLVGIVSFAMYPDTVCPPTLAHEVIPKFLETISIASGREANATAIGEGLALAAARLKAVEETLAKQLREGIKDYEIKSKIIILLTDGESNTGRGPEEAAKLAAEWGIKIYTISIGGRMELAMNDRFQPVRVQRRNRGAEAVLQRVADQTGGIFRYAEDGKALREVYEEINQLEKSEIESLRYMDYREEFIPFALTALLLILLEILLQCTVLRKIP